MGARVRAVAVAHCVDHALGQQVAHARPPRINTPCCLGPPRAAGTGLASGLALLRLARVRVGVGVRVILTLTSATL